MATRQRRTGAEKGKGSVEQKDGVDVKMVEMVQTIKEATGATEEDVKLMLEECNFDANETTSRLIDNPFSQVQSRKDKKKKRDEDKKKEPVSKVMEVRRNSTSGGRGRGHDRERGQRGDRGGDRGGERGGGDRGDRGSRSQALPSVAPQVEKLQPVGEWGGDATGGDWEASAAREVEPPVEQPPPSPGSWGDIGSRAPGHASTQPPIVKSAQPALIRPPGVATPGGPTPPSGTATRSMADLFKNAGKPAAPAPAPAAVPTLAPQEPPASHSADAGQHSGESQPETSGEVNGWGSTQAETDSSRQNSSLGGVAISAPKKSAPSQQLPIQSSGAAGTSGTLFPGQTPVGSLTNVASSPQRSKHDESPRNHTGHTAWGASAPSGSSGLGGELVAPPPRQQYSSETPSLTQQSWQPKASLAHPHPSGNQSTLGSAVMSSLAPTSLGTAPSGSVDGGIPPSAASPRASHQLGVSGSAFTNHSPVVMPHANHQESTDLSNLNLSFGSFDLAPGASQDTGAFSSGFASGFGPSASAHSHSELPASLGPAAQLHDPYKQSFQMNQPQSQQPTQQQQQMNARAYNAFTSASSGLTQAPSSAASQRIMPPAFQPEASTTAPATSHSHGSGALYGSQGTQGYAGYSLPTGQQAYQNYSSFQVPEQEQAPAASHAASHPTSQAATTPGPSTTTSAKSSLPYDANSYASYSQGGGKDFQPAKYGGSATQATNLAAANPATAQHLAAVAAQTPLQVPSMASYTGGQQGFSQQGYGQQGYAGSSNYAPTYANNSYGHSTNYGGGGVGYQQPQLRATNPYQQQPQAGYGNQAAKYGGGAGFAGGNYQHGGGNYGVQGHKQEKDHQASHLAGNLYSSQLQQPLGGQGQHFQNSQLQANQGYGTYPQNQGFNPNNYGMGGGQGRQQYPNYYPRE